MKTHIRSLMILSLAATAAIAQPPAGPDGDWEEPLPPPPAGDSTPPGPDGAHPRPLQMFFERLKQNNPEEYERLKKLREEMPEAFRAELAKIVKHLREVKMRGMGPGGRPLEGDEILRMIDRREMQNPEIEALERKSRELARQWRESTDPAEKERLTDELNDVLAQAFDQREAARRKRLEQAEKRIEQVRQSLDERAAKRDEIIARRLQELTGGDTLGW